MYYTTNIGQFCELNSNYEYLLSNAPYYVTTKHYFIEDTEYVMFCYNQIKSDFSNDIVKECRGIIFKRGHWDKPVCHAFDKFHNYGETYASNIDWNTARVTEKIDGSLIKVWYNKDTDNFVISTNGTINAFEAELNNPKYKTFGELFVNGVKDLSEFIDICKRNNRSTYMFELVSPFNRVVIPYEDIDIYFLGERDFNDNLTSFTDSICTKDFESIGIKTPEVYPLFSLYDVISASKKLPWNEEGYVVQDALNNRIKVKSPKYVIAHYARNNNQISKKYLIDVVLKNEQEEFKTYCSDYNSELTSIEADMTEYQQNLQAYYNKLRITLPINYTRKEYAAIVKTYPTWAQPYLFSGISVYNYVSNWNSSKWEKELAKREESL